MVTYILVTFVLDNFRGFTTGLLHHAFPALRRAPPKRLLGRPAQDQQHRDCSVLKFIFLFLYYGYIFFKFSKLLARNKPLPLILSPHCPQTRDKIYFSSLH